MQFDATRYKPIQGGLRADTGGDQHIARTSGSHATSSRHENVGLSDPDHSCLQPGHDLGRGPGTGWQLGPNRCTQGRGSPLWSRVRGTRGRQGPQRRATAGNIRPARRPGARPDWQSRTSSHQGPRPDSFVQQATPPREDTMNARAAAARTSTGGHYRNDRSIVMTHANPSSPTVLIAMLAATGMVLVSAAAVAQNRQQAQPGGSWLGTADAADAATAEASSRARHEPGANHGS